MTKRDLSLGYPVWVVTRSVDSPIDNWSAFNPSVATEPNGSISMLVRSSNYLLGITQNYTTLTVGKEIANQLWFSELDKNLNPVRLRQITVQGSLPFTRGVEDARLCWRDGGWHFTAVILEHFHTEVARIGLFSLDVKTNTAQFIEKLDTPNPKRVEKNWGVLANGVSSEFDYIYGPNTVYKDGKILSVGEVLPKMAKIRGGTQLIEWEDGYLSVEHYMRMVPKPLFNPLTFAVQGLDLRNYTHVFVKRNKQGKIVATSEEFVFDIGGVEFAAGLVKHGDSLLISYGRNDLSGWLTQVDIETVVSMLRTVKYPAKIE